LNSLSLSLLNSLELSLSLLNSLELSLSLLNSLELSLPYTVTVGTGVKLKASTTVLVSLPSNSVYWKVLQML
jgi:hypothetical protein